MTVSHWRVQHSGMTGGSGLPSRADLVVLGGGVAGVSAALEAERRGMETLVLERRRVAWEASGRNAGFLMRGMAESYAVAVKEYGRERARHAWRVSEENLRSLVALGVDGLRSFQRIPSVIVATSEDEREKLRESLRLLKEDGFDALWLDDGADALWESGIGLGGLVNPHDGAVNPVEMMRFLAGKLRSPVREGVEAYAIAPAKGGLRVRTSEGDVVASRVMLCTNAFARELLPSLRGVVEPKRGQMLAVKLLGVDEAPWRRLDASYYLNYGHEYVRQTFDGSVVLGGYRWMRRDTEVGYEDAPQPELQGALEGLAHELFAEGEDDRAFEVVARWSGVMGFSPDGMPLVGPVREEWNGSGAAWFCGGFTGHGMSLGHRTATLAVGAMLGEGENPFPLGRGAGSGE